MVRNCVQNSKSYCWPLKLQVALVILGIIGVLVMPSHMKTTDGKVVQIDKASTLTRIIIVGGIWTAIFYYLCKNCHYTWAWVLFLGPIVFAILMGIFILTFRTKPIESYGYPSAARNGDIYIPEDSSFDVKNYSSKISECKQMADRLCPTSPVDDAMNCRQRKYINCIYGATPLSE